MYRHSRTEYDDEPVHYCRRCHSLAIVSDPDPSDPEWDGAYCRDCGSTDIGECDIDDWVKEEERRLEQKRKREWSR